MIKNAEIGFKLFFQYHFSGTISSDFCILINSGVSFFHEFDHSMVSNMFFIRPTKLFCFVIVISAVRLRLC